MKKQRELIWPSEYAKRKGVSKGRISQWASEGRLIFRGKLVDVAASDAMLEASALPSLNGKTASPALERYREQATRRAAAAAGLLELTTAERAGKLCDRAQAIEAWDSQLMRLRDRMLALPRHMAPLVLTVRTPAEIEGMLADYISSALDDLADGSTGIPKHKPK